MPLFLQQSTYCDQHDLFSQHLILNLNTHTNSIIVNVFLAQDVFNCWITVPFNPAVGSRFIKYCNDTLQFQSTLAYLKNPPASYQQAPVDLIGGLNEIQGDIDAGVFKNQYSFEATLLSLLYQSHDAHIQLYAGLFATFTFGTPFELASVSSDGIQVPKVYIASTDVLNARGSMAC